MESSDLARPPRSLPTRSDPGEGADLRWPPPRTFTWPRAPLAAWRGRESARDRLAAVSDLRAAGKEVGAMKQEEGSIQRAAASAQVAAIGQLLGAGAGRPGKWYGSAPAPHLALPQSATAPIADRAQAGSGAALRSRKHSHRSWRRISDRRGCHPGPRATGSLSRVQRASPSGRRGLSPSSPGAASPGRRAE